MKHCFARCHRRHLLARVGLVPRITGFENLREEIIPSRQLVTLPSPRRGFMTTTPEMRAEYDSLVTGFKTAFSNSDFVKLGNYDLNTLHGLATKLELTGKDSESHRVIKLLDLNPPATKIAKNKLETPTVQNVSRCRVEHRARNGHTDV